MSVFLIGLVCVVYFGIAVSNVIEQDYPHAFIWASYALANIGFIWYELTKETT